MTIVAWLLQATKAYAIKLVNPGGVELWKFRGNVHTLDDEVTGFGVTPRDIVQTLSDVSHRAEACPIRCTSTATIWALPGTGKRPWRR